MIILYADMICKNTDLECIFICLCVYFYLLDAQYLFVCLLGIIAIFS